MSYSGFMVVAVIGAVLGVAVLFRRRIPAAQRTTLREATLWSIAEIPDGALGRVSGVVRAIDGHTLEAPISGTACVFYETRVHTDHPLPPVAEGISFELDDGTGTAAIDISHANSALPASHHERNGVLTAPTPRQIAFLDRFAYRGNYLSVRYDETVIAIGDRITVYGVATRGSAVAIGAIIVGDDTVPAARPMLPAATLRRR